MQTKQAPHSRLDILATDQREYITGVRPMHDARSVYLAVMGVANCIMTNDASYQLDRIRESDDDTTIASATINLEVDDILICGSVERFGKSPRFVSFRQTSDRHPPERYRQISHENFTLFTDRGIDTPAIEVSKAGFMAAADDDTVIGRPYTNYIMQGDVLPEDDPARDQDPSRTITPETSREIQAHLGSALLTHTDKGLARQRLSTEITALER